MKTEKQLRVLAQWLKEEEDNICFERDGSMEIAIKYAVQESLVKIGDYIEEILDMDDEQLNIE